MKRRGKIKASWIIIAGVCLVFIMALFFADTIIEKKISGQFSEFSPTLQIKFSRVRSRLLSSSLSFDSLQISFAPYPEHQEERHILLFKKVSFQGISFLNYLFHKKLVAKDLALAGGDVRFNRSLLQKRDSVQMKMVKALKWPFRALSIDRIQLSQTNFFLQAAHKDELLARGSVTFSAVSIDKPGNRPVFSGFDMDLSNIDYPFSDFTLRIRQLHVSSTSKSLAIKSLQLSKTGDQSAVKFGSINISEIDVSKLLDEQVLTCRKIKVEDGNIALTKDDVGVIPGLKQIKSDVFDLLNSHVTFQGNGNIVSFNANLELGKLQVGETFDKKNLHFASVTATMSELHYSGKDYQTARIRKIELSSTKQYMRAVDLNIIPKIGKYELGRRLGHQVDWVAANISAVDVSRPDIEGLLHNKFLAEKVFIGPSRVYVFRDRRLVRPQKFIALPVESLKKVPFDVRVQHVMLASSTVEYEEFPKTGYGQTGVLVIKNAKVEISPLINRPRASDPAYLTMTTTGSIMGSGTAHGTVMMPLVKSKSYHIKGAIERLQLPRLNSSSENLGKIRIKSGFLDFLSFDFTMTEQRSKGKIICAYHRLIIQQLKKHTDEKNVADFASFMLRHLIIPLNKDASVPERKRTGNVDYVRDPTRFVSYYFLQSLLMGVKKSFALGFLLPK